MKGPFFDYKIQEESDSVQRNCFVEPMHLDKLLDNYHTSFIFGERGSGKTTILKYLERKMNEEMSQRWVAFYYRFETATMKSMYNARLDEEDNIANFQQAMCAIFIKQLCAKLIGRKKEYTWSEEKNICKNVSGLVVFPESYEIETFEELYNLVEKIRIKTLFNIRSRKTEMYIDYTNALETFVTAIREKVELGDIRLCILLDEYENLLPIQQRVINSMVKDASNTVCYKICLRPEGFWTRQTVAEREYLKENDDYISIHYVRDIMGNDVEIQNLVRGICYNRLELYLKGMSFPYTEKFLNIDNYLETLTIKNELKKISKVEEYQKQLIAEIQRKITLTDAESVKQLEQISDILDLQIFSIMLEKGRSFNEIYESIVNRSPVYLNWLHNYQMNAAYIIFEECGEKKRYSGLDIIIRLAGCNMRTILLILSYIFEDYEFKAGEIKKISITKQDEAINKIAKMSFNQIEFIPVHGIEVKNLTNALGNLFKEYIKDKQAKKFETNNFTIRVSGSLQDEEYCRIKDVLQDAVMWGILLETDSNKVKNSIDYTYENKDYILHPIYAIYFGISYRTKQKTYLDDVDVKLMLEPLTNKEIRRIAKIIDKEVPGQMKLLDFVSEE